MNHKPPTRWNMICHLHRGQMSQYHLQLVASSKTKMTKDVFRKPSYKPEIKNIVVHFMFFPKPHWCNKQTRNNKWTMKTQEQDMCVCVCACVLMYARACVCSSLKLTLISASFVWLLTKEELLCLSVCLLSFSFCFPIHLSICSVLISFSVISWTDCTFTVLYAYEM